MRIEEKKAFINKVKESLPGIIDTIHDPTLQLILALKAIELLSNLERIPTVE